MDKVFEIIEEIRNFTLEEDNSVKTLSKADAIRLIDYIDRLEDKDSILRVLLDKNIEINIKQ